MLGTGGGSERYQIRKITFYERKSEEVSSRASSKNWVKQMLQRSKQALGGYKKASNDNTSIRVWINTQVWLRSPHNCLRTEYNSLSILHTHKNLGCLFNPLSVFVLPRHVQPDLNWLPSPPLHWNCPVKVSLFSSCSTSLQLSAPWNHFSSCLLWPLILPVLLWSQWLLFFSLLLSDCLPTFSPPSPALLPEYPGMLCAFLLSIFSSKRNSSLHDCFK